MGVAAGHPGSVTITLAMSSLVSISGAEPGSASVDTVITSPVWSIGTVVCTWRFDPTGGRPELASMHMHITLSMGTHTPQQGFWQVCMQNRSHTAGVPGGCGTPSVFIAARNSPESHQVTPGASVTTYAARRSDATVSTTRRPVTLRL